MLTSRSSIGLLVVAHASLALAQPVPDEAPPPPPPPPPAPQAQPPPPPPAPATPKQPEPENAYGQASPPPPEKAPEPGTTMEVYGFTMFDGGFDFGQIGDPDWQDVLRPTKLPSFNDEYGKGPRTFMGVRQTRFGVKTTTPTDHGEIKTVFEWELFGVGVDAGQTTFRLRHAYGTWHHLRAGQTWSPFMDPDVFPDSIEYWGPPGMIFFRNVQLAYSFYEDTYSDFTVALERPGGSADTSGLQNDDHFDLTNVVPRFPAPDVSADLKAGGPWGHVRLAGIMRYMQWDDLSPTPIIQGHAWGWGVNGSANVKIGPAVLKLQVAYGHGIENYFNDAGADVAPASLDPPTTARVEGVAVPVLGVVGFVDWKWCDLLTSTAGYSLTWMDNTAGQLPDAFHEGQYALGNVLIHPVKNLLFGPEFQWGRRSNNSDGFSVNDYRIQFSVKYNFSRTFGGV